MTCGKRMEERIVHFAAGELPAIETWLLRRHLRACEACRVAWNRTEALRLRLRSRAHCPTDSALDARVLEALSAVRPADPATTAPRFQRRALRGRAGLALGAAALVAAGTFPFWGPLPGVAAGDVRTALARVETWHGRGWKTVEGRKVEWEVWGRRSPYLYWARVGDQVRVDNGRERLEATAAAGSGGRSGVVLRARSRPGLDDWTLHPGELFGARMAELQPDKEGWRTTTFSTPLWDGHEKRIVQFVVDRGAHVPVQYVVRPVQEGEPTESLALNYGVELPQSVTQPHWPEGYRRLDLLRTEPGQAVSAPGVATAGGFSVQVTPLTLDRAGNVLVRVRGRLDSMPLDAGAPFLLWVSDREEGAPLATDERGREYRYVPLEWLRLLQHLRLNGDRLMLFAPARPLTGKAPLPRSLKLKLKVAATPSNRLNRTPGFDSVSVEERFRWSLALPERPAPIRPERWLGAGWREVVGSTGIQVESVESAVARLRAAPEPAKAR